MVVLPQDTTAEVYWGGVSDPFADGRLVLLFEAMRIQSVVIDVFGTYLLAHFFPLRMRKRQDFFECISPGNFTSPKATSQLFLFTEGVWESEFCRSRFGILVCCSLTALYFTVKPVDFGAKKPSILVLTHKS